MSKRTAALLVAGALLAGGVGAVAITPASAATSDIAVVSRLAGIKDALNGLVTDGTITQKQADVVAETLAEAMPKHGPGGPGGPGHMGGRHLLGGLDAAAKALDMTEAELRTALESGTSLADVATEEGVSVDSLIATMVAAAEKQLATAVADGNLTQAQADQIKVLMSARITDMVNGVRPEHGFGGQPPSPSDLPSGNSNVSTSSVVLTGTAV